MRPRLPSDPTTRALHGFLLTIVAPVVGIALDVFLVAFAESTNPLAYAAASSLILGPLAKRADDDSAS